jgi:hypothetical protein
MKKNLLFLILVAASFHSASFGQCVLPFEAGNWVNMDAATRGITRIKVDFSCNDVVLCGVDANGNRTCPPPPPPFQVQLWGKCSPSDCDWARVAGNYYSTSDGTWIYSYYDHGFARRWVYVKRSALYPGKLFLWMYTHFTDGSGRADYILRNWFNRS